MEGIYQATNAFDFNKITMISPTIIPGGNYFIKFRMNDIPLYIQTPKCKVKQGILKSGKKLYCDLMFTHENEDFICWMENLENYCQKKIYENRQKWFETPLDEHDIENSFTSPLKLYKSGKFYISRTNVPSLLGNCSLKIYNENEELVPIENIQENMDVVSILEIQGIKCSARSFQIEMEIKQMMVMNPINLFEKCILKKSLASSSSTSTTTTSFAGSANTNLSVIDNDNKKSLSEDNDNHLSESENKLQNTNASVIPLPTNDVYDVQNIHIELKEHIDVNEVNEENIDTNTNTNDVIDANSDNTIIENTPLTNDSNDHPIDSNIDTHTDTHDCIDKDDEEDEEDEDYSYEDDDDYKRDKIVIQEDSDLMEIDLDLDDLHDLDPPVHIKNRNDIYYDMYREAKRKAKMARDLAIASYLEAKNIKNTYMIVDDDDSDLEEESFQHIEK